MFEAAQSRIDKGLIRLLRGPKDLARWDKALVDPGANRASAQHRALHDDYVRTLRGVVDFAVKQWQAEIDAGRQRYGDAARALDEQWKRYPAGPAATPEFVAVVRRYWLECDRLNQAMPPQASVPPEDFLLGWLAARAGTRDESVRVLACMPYWPIGLDADLHWI